MGRPRKRKKAVAVESDSDDGRPAQVSDPACERTSGRDDAAQSLIDHMLLLYATGRLDAKAFCLLAHFSVAAGVRSNDLAMYSRKPGLQSGKYSQHLKSVLPVQVGPDDLHSIDMPAYVNGRRQLKKLHCVPLYDVLEKEIDLAEESGEVVQVPESSDWSDTFNSHKLRHLPGDPRTCYPLGLYADKIKYTRSIGPGKSDSVLAITAFNLCTGSRHLLYVVSQRQLCRCGCKTWCSIYTVLEHLKYSIAAASRGVYPLTTHDGSPWEAGSFGARMAGKRMKSRFILTQIKSDWAEMVHTFGLPSWSCHHSPCFKCCSLHSQLYKFDGLTLQDSPWGDKPTTYEEECARCEIHVYVSTDAIRNKMLANLKFDKKRGRVFTSELVIGGTRIHQWDRLEPCSSLPDIGQFESKPVPFWCTLWHRHSDSRGRCTDWVTHRNPVFCAETGCSPDHLHLDVMHCLYLGVFSRYCHAVIRTSIADNVFRVDLSPVAREDETLKKIYSAYKLWCQTREPPVPLSYQISELTRPMVGDDDTPILKLKAVETRVFMEFCTQFCWDRVSEFPALRKLANAGQALVDYMGILRDQPFIMSWSVCSELLGLCLRHIELMRLAGFTDLPKTHMYAHLTTDMLTKGNARMYGTFLDEGLNLVIAKCAASCHRSVWERSIFQRIRLLPYVSKTSSFAIV